MEREGGSKEMWVLVCLFWLQVGQEYPGFIGLCKFGMISGFKGLE